MKGYRTKLPDSVQTTTTYRDASVTKLKTDLQWTSLEDRRKMSRLCMMYKMTNKLVDVPTDKYLIPAQKRTRNIHVSDFKYKSYQPRIDVFKNSYFPRTIVERNLLSPSTVGASSLDSFKEHLQIDVQKLDVTGRSV